MKKIEDGVEKEVMSQRCWYVGAGAATGLAAVEFLNRLQKEIFVSGVLGDIQVVLFEGFHTFKYPVEKGKTRPPHSQDAYELLEVVLQGEEKIDRLQVKAELATPLQPLYPGERRAPAIVEVWREKEESSSFSKYWVSTRVQ